MSCYGDNRNLHALTHSFPTRRSSDLVDMVCPYCGVGCALTYYVDRERGGISFAEGRDQTLGNQGRLCVKGRYGWDYAASPRSEEHTSELQSLMRISYAVFCLKKQNTNTNT